MFLENISVVATKTKSDDHSENLLTFDVWSKPEPDLLSLTQAKSLSTAFSSICKNHHLLGYHQNRQIDVRNCYKITFTC